MLLFTDLRHEFEVLDKLHHLFALPVDHFHFEFVFSPQVLLYFLSVLFLRFNRFCDQLELPPDLPNIKGELPSLSLDDLFEGLQSVV